MAGADRRLARIPWRDALGFTLVAIRIGAVTESRKIKPRIPLEGADGTPTTDELEFELPLERASG
jgi:hypothetical protein